MANGYGTSGPVPKLIAMKQLFVVLTGFVAVAFLAALAIAAVPLLAGNDSTHWTAPATDVEPGQFTEIERPDLSRPTLSPQYSAPQVPGTQSHRIVTGIRPENWVSYAPGAATGPRAMVFLFPGAGRPAMSMIDMWQATARRENLVLIAIDGLPGGAAAETPDTDLILGVLAAAQERFDIDPDRIYLFGHSAGSILAQVVVNRVEGPWRAAAGHAGYVIPAWIHKLEGAAPTRHYLGSSDRLFSPADARTFGQQATIAGHDHEFILIPGHTHWFYEIGPSIAADAWAWFDSLPDPNSLQ